MNYDILSQKKERLDVIRKQLPKEALVSFDKNFEVEYAHNSTAIEGNTLSLIQTKAVLEDGISIGGKTLREIYEVVNHQKAFEFINRCIIDGKLLDEKIVKGIFAGGKFVFLEQDINHLDPVRCITRLKIFILICYHTGQKEMQLSLLHGHMQSL